MLRPLAVIALMSRTRHIGDLYGLEWHYPYEKRQFRKITKNHVVIMGRKTYDKLKRPIPDCRNIIISRDRTFSAPGCEVCYSIDHALDVANDGIFSEKIPIVIGGAEIYELAIAQATRMYLMIVDKNIKSERIFPYNYLRDEWETVDRICRSNLEFKILERRNTYLDLR